MKRALLCVSGALICLALVAPAQNVQYKFSAAGSFPGAAYTIPLAANLTQIVGYHVVTNNDGGYIETVGNKSDAPAFLGLQPPGSGTSYAAGITAAGVAVGGFCGLAGCNPTAADHGFTYDHGVYTTIDYPQAGATTAAYGINDLGEIVGGFCSGPYACPVGAFTRTAHGFLDNQGVFTQLDYPGSQDTQANAINNAGVITGAYDVNNTGPHGFLYQNGAYKTIDMPGALYTLPSAINNHGVVAGYYEQLQGGNLSIHGFLYHDGEFTTVNYPGTHATNVYGVNDDGMIVGTWLPPMGLWKTFKGIPVH
jgi:uncharacterized membrane protein